MHDIHKCTLISITAYSMFIGYLLHSGEIWPTLIYILPIYYNSQQYYGVTCSATMSHCLFKNNGTTNNRRQVGKKTFPLFLCQREYVILGQF